MLTVEVTPLPKNLTPYGVLFIALAAAISTVILKSKS